jgi:hypothetical protein
MDIAYRKKVVGVFVRFRAPLHRCMSILLTVVTYLPITILMRILVLGVKKKLTALLTG